MRWSLAIAIGAMTLTGCQPSHADAVASLQADFPVIERLGVTNLMTFEDCDYIAYKRGAFVTDPSSNACNIDIDGPHPRQRFDARARADLDALLRESEQHGPRLQHAFVNFAPDGTVTRDSWLGFSFGTSYVYDPGAAAKVTTTDDSTCQEPVDDDWYRDWICF